MREGIVTNEVKNEENIFKNKGLDLKQKNSSGTIQDLNDKHVFETT
jgi:hypothetical protein